MLISYQLFFIHLKIFADFPLWLGTVLGTEISERNFYSTAFGKIDVDRGEADILISQTLCIVFPCEGVYHVPSVF